MTFELVDRDEKCQAGLLLRLLATGGKAEEVTDADGKASFLELAPGRYGFTISGEGLPELVSAREIVLLAGEAKALVLTVGPFDLTLSGTVLDGDGRPVSEVIVHAQKHLLVPEEGDFALADPWVLQVTTEPNGRFAFGSLEAWEYLVYTEPVRGERSRTIARAGSTRVILKLMAPRMAQVHGQVLSATERTPVAGAVVTLLSPSDAQAVSGPDGTYALDFEVREDQPVYIFDAVAEGYRRARFRVNAAELTGQPTGQSTQGSAGGPTGPSTWQVDIAMEPTRATAVVGGTVFDDKGKAAEGLSVLLSSPALRLNYRGTSDAQGRFRIESVQAGDTYRLSIEPGRGFKDYVEEGLQVPDEGIDLAIRLTPVQLGSLQGVMVDPGGSPVPRFTLKVTPREARSSSVTVTGDEEGGFQLAQAPAGDLIFEGGSPQEIEIRGLRLDKGGAAEVTLVLDVGEHRFGGTVIDHNGVPLPGVHLTVQWSTVAHGLRSSSLRRTRTDVAGKFALSGLGSGPHRVSASSPGFIPAQITCDVGLGEPETVIKLRRKDS